MGESVGGIAATTKKGGRGMTNKEAKEIIECREMIDAMSERANEALDMAIKALEQEPRWIPVSDRLPKEAESVLVYAERNAYDDKGKFRKKVIDIGWQVDGRWHIDGCSGVDGMAWMPLPQPYKAESENQE